MTSLKIFGLLNMVLSVFLDLMLMEKKLEVSALNESSNISYISELKYLGKF